MTTPKSTILRIAIPSPLWQCFDYLPLEHQDLALLVPGLRVSVPFGRREVTGMLVEIASHSAFKETPLKTILRVIDDAPLLSSSDLDFYRWASTYYHYPFGEVLFSAMPSWLRQGKSLASLSHDKENHQSRDPAEMPTLNSDQALATDTINQATGFQTFLLSGVTGSGKTEVYLRCISEQLRRGKQALILVPEISLTPQTVDRFRARFSEPIALLHSNLPPKKRALMWAKAQQGVAKIIIGTRSSILTPLPALGIIVLDEEHDPSFKQTSGFRYSARDLAIRRAQLLNIPVVLGSATPSLESAFNAKMNRYHQLHLPNRITETAETIINILDIRKEQLQDGLSPRLISAMERHLRLGQQVLLFLNRRGFAPTIMCHHCGWIMHCTRCDSRLTWHQDPPQVSCHHCGFNRKIPKHCSDCRQSELIPVGLGTERIEETLAARYPEYSILRIDRDSTRKKNSLQEKLLAIHEGSAQILIGTQLLAKGHHFPKLTLVAIVDADTGLLGADFRSLERMGQLFIQVAGRAGRDVLPGEVYLQTHYPDHPLLNLLITKNYSNFTEALLKEREIAKLPPYSHMALLRAEATKSALAIEFLQQIKIKFKAVEIELLGPIPAVIEKRANRYRYQLLFQSLKRSQLHRVLQELMQYLTTLKNRKVRWSLDIDPQEMS